MATVNKPLYVGDGLTVSFDYDDVTFRILTVHVVNEAARSFVVNAFAAANNKNYQFTINAGVELHQAVPQNAANRLGLSVTPSGKLDGVEWSIS